MTRVIRHIRRTITTEVWVIKWNDGESSATSPPMQISHTIFEWIEKQSPSLENSRLFDPDENLSFGNNIPNPIS